MATQRLNAPIVGLSHEGQNSETVPWQSSGSVVASTVICNVPCLLGGFALRVTDVGQDAVIEVYDAATADDTGVMIMCGSSVTVQKANHVSMHSVPRPGIKCEIGIYLKVVSGDV